MKRKKLLAFMLAAVMSVSGIGTPAMAVSAEEMPETVMSEEMVEEGSQPETKQDSAEETKESSKETSGQETSKEAIPSVETVKEEKDPAETEKESEKASVETEKESEKVSAETKEEDKNLSETDEKVPSEETEEELKDSTSEKTDADTAVSQQPEEETQAGEEPSSETEEVADAKAEVRTYAINTTTFNYSGAVSGMYTMENVIVTRQDDGTWLVRMHQASTNRNVLAITSASDTEDVQKTKATEHAVDWYIAGGADGYTFTVPVATLDVPLNACFSSLDRIESKKSFGGPMKITFDTASMTETTEPEVTAAEIIIRKAETGNTEITLDKDNLELQVGEQETLTATVTPAEMAESLSWNSDNEQVATVEDGVVTAVSEGTATITAKAGDQTAACKVTVTKPATEVKKLTIINTTGMFKVVSASLETTEGQTVLRFALNSTGYEDLMIGSYEEAVATTSGDTPDKSKWLHYTVNEAGKYEFVTPLADGQTYVPVQALSASYVKKGQYRWYPRQMQLDLEKLTLTTGDYDHEDGIKLTNSASFLKVDSVGLHTVGGPNSNNYKEILKLYMNGTDIDQAYIGTAKEAETAESVITLENGTFALTVKANQMGGAAAYDYLEKEMTVAFRQAADKRWKEVKVTVSKTGKTVVIVPAPIPAEKITLDKETLELEAGKKETLTATVTPADTTDTVSWSSDNEKVATVKDGVVTAVSEGTATITAKAGDQTAVCKVTVTKPATEVKELTIINTTGMFKVVSASLETTGGQTVLRFALNSTGYEDLMIGSYEEAAATTSGDTPDKSKWLHYTVNEAGKYEFVTPLANGQTYVPVQALSANYVKKGQYRWYPRQMQLDLEKLTLTTGDYDHEDGIKLTNSVPFLKVDSAGLHTVGGPSSNNYKEILKLYMNGTDIDQAYIGTAKEAETAESVIALENGTFALTVKANQMGGAAAYDYLEKEMTVAFRQAADKCWKEVKITVSKTGKTVVISLEGSGEPVPTPPDKPTPTDPDPTDPDPATPGETTKPTGNDGKEDEESKYESDLSGSTAAVDSSTGLKDGVYVPDSFSWSGGTGRVSITCNKVTVKNGQAYATIVFSSSSYTYVKANGRKYYGNNGSFTIPVALNKNNKIIGLTTKMSAPHEIEYNIYIYLADAAKADGTNSDVVIGAGQENNNKLDEKAPQIIGLTYVSETKLEYAEYFKIYHYQDGVTLLEIDMTKDTARDPKLRKDAEAEKKEKTEASSQEEKTAGLYMGNVVKYLLVPENAEIPVGLEKEVIVVPMPVEKTHVASEETLAIMEELDLLDTVQALSFEKEDCPNEELAKAMDEEKIIFAGAYDEIDYKALVKAKCGLSFMTSEILPHDEESKKDDQKNAGDEEVLTLDEQTERLQTMAENFAMLEIPVLVDRSADEETELGQYEWIKVYGVIFGCEEKADKLFNQAVENAKKEGK